MGDALAVALMKARRFEAHHFARFHPGGTLGRRLLRRVREEMRSENLPFVQRSDDATTVLGVVGDCQLGVALVCDRDQALVGIITDGDLRRALRAHERGFFDLTAEQLMTPEPISIKIDSNMNAAIELMTQHHITLLVVMDNEQVVGVVQK
jgi:arabinose-5-phosphate isomerase